MVDPFPLIDLTGAPRERGRAYGKQAADRISRGLAMYSRSFAGCVGGIEEPCRRYLTDLEQLAPDLAGELRGIAEGAGRSVEEIVALNARTELTGWDSKPEAAEVDGCTSALAMPGTTRDGRLLHGQNWDWRPDAADTAVVLRIRTGNGPDILTFCEAGQLARHGMNSEGLALTANGLQTDKDFLSPGLPSPFARRMMLACPTLAGATGILLNTPRASSHNLMLSQLTPSGEAEAINFEVTAEDVFWSFPQDGLLTHANHFTDPLARTAYRDIGLLRHPETLYRDRRVMSRLMADRGWISKVTFETAFADRFGAPDAVCRSPTPRTDGSVSATVATLIMDAAAGSAWIAPSPYEGARYSCYGFDR